MMDRPTVKATIGGVEYPLYLNLYAIEEINEKFGGVKASAEKMLSDDNYNEAIDAAAELVAILAGQGVMYENFLDPDHRREPITAEGVKLFCTPKELGELQGAILEALISGSNHTVESEPPEDDSKNPQDE